tara:strand:+ start:5498 stop:5707 length:210 start_codon:yes stop_codon:yes gene_type:complete
MLSISCRECGHDNEFMNLVEASAVIGMHPESLRRLNRFGDITSLNIERGVYFTDEQVKSFLINRKDEEE